MIQLIRTTLGISVVDGRLSFAADNVQAPEHSTRSLEALVPVLAQSEELPPETVVYDMYRNAHLAEHAGLVSDNEARYDITVIKPLPLGLELPKTFGHYHPCPPGKEASYPELYQVLSGQARYLIQKPSPDWGSVASAWSIAANPGDIIVMPPGFGHVTVNSGDKPLVMANWVASSFDSVYGDYRDRRGACYYVLRDGGAVPNHRYGNLPELHQLNGNEATRRLFERLGELWPELSVGIGGAAGASPGEPVGGQAACDGEKSGTAMPCMYGLFIEQPRLFALLHNPRLLLDLYG